ncbi:MAG: putative OsmC-related protein [Chloroflexi bacterium]|nr:MAG: putative OsmC-related protein [Chloroflexota bacterium]
MTTTTSVNGLSVEGIQGMVEMVTAQPEVAKAVFSATTIWRGGFHNEAVVKPFSMGGARNDTSRQKAFTIVGDHPQELLGTDKGPSSVEVLLAALGHCLASGWATYGATMGVSIEGLRIEVEGDIDLQGMLALPVLGAVPPGFQEIRASYYVKSSAPREQLEQVAKMAEDLSPTRHSLRAVDFSSQLTIQE